MSKTLQTLNEKKVSFIMCCNNTQYQKECTSYLEELEIPEGYEVEILPIIGAKSMAAGYNQGMRQSDAKYKVYLHQDVMIWNRHFIYDILNIFESNRSVGMLGVLGGIDLPDNGIAFLSWNVGSTYACNIDFAGIIQKRNPAPGTFEEVEAIDGMLMATQYDVPWREDLFDSWDFYDISQSFEFRKRGYSVVIPYQDTPWCLHDCGQSKLQNYNYGRKIILQEYPSFFHHAIYKESDFPYNYDLKSLFVKSAKTIIQCMELGNLELAKQACSLFQEDDINDNDLPLLKQLVTVCDTEKQIYGQCQTWKPGELYNTLKERYNQLKFLLWDAEQDRNSGKKRFTESLQQNRYSIPFIVTVGIHNTLCSFNKMIPMLAECARTNRNEKELKYLEDVCKQLYLKTYEKCDTDTDYKTVEEVAVIEQECRMNAKQQKEELPGYRKRINQFLKMKDYKNLSCLLSEKEFNDKFQTVTDITYMILTNQIFQKEMSEGVARTIFDGHTTITEVISFLQEIKFAIWRLEFEIDEDAGMRLLNFIQQNQISACLLKYVVHIAGMDKTRLLGNLAALFLDHNIIGMAFAMLKYADELQPGSEEILCTMAELCIQAGRKEEALFCLDQVKWPTKITESLRKMCES